MQPINIWIVLACVWCLTNLWLFPLSKDRWKDGDLRQKITRAGTLAVLEKVRDLAAIGVVTVTLVLLSVWIASTLAIVSFTVPKALIAAAASVYGIAKAWADGYAGVLGFWGLVGAAITLYLTASHARKRITDAWLVNANQVYSRLRENPPEISQAKQDAELLPLVEQIEELLIFLSQHDQFDQESSISTEQMEEIQKELSSRLWMLAVEIARKEFKFDTAISTPSDEETGIPYSWKQKLMRALTSERFCKDLGLIKKPLSYLVTALLLISLIGWTAEPLANSLQLAVNNLRINVLDQDAKRELDAALTHISPTAPEGEKSDDYQPNSSTAQATTRLLAREVTRDILHSGLLDGTSEKEQRILSKSEFVRASILNQQIDLPDDADAVSRIRKEVAEDVLHHADDSVEVLHLQEHIERELHPHVERLQKDNPSLFAKLSSKLEARYIVPMSPLDAQEKLVARVLDEVLDGIDVHPANELGKQSQKLVHEFGDEAVKTWVNAHTKNFVKDLITDTARSGVLNGFRFETSNETEQFINSLQAAEGHGWVGGGKERDTAKMSKAVANTIASYYEDKNMQIAAAERLGGYDNLFPQADNNLGVENFDGGGGGGGGGGKSSHSQSHGKPYIHSRATNFYLASRSFRVRGVLIGQDLSSKGIEAKDISWNIQPANVKESLPTRIKLDIQFDGNWHNLGSFDAAVVNQALRYAADRRVIATTITPGDGKIVGRVTYLHPVLADTPLGCRIVEADRFVDTFTYNSTRGNVAQRLTQLASDRAQIGRWLVVMNLAEKVASIPPNESCPLDLLKEAIKENQLGDVKFSPAVTDSFEQFFINEEKNNPSSTKFLRVASECATTKSQELASCLCEKVKSEGLPYSYWFPEDHTSQFRESQTTLNNELLWMKRSKDNLGHIDLWVHTTFSLRKKSFGGDAENLDESSAFAVDFPQKELRSLKEVITEELPQYLATQLRSPNYDEFMMPLEDFVILQRFMRSALSGGLGDDFPLAKLIQLERDSRKFVPYQPTIRWEPAQNSDDVLIASLNEADADASKTYLAWKNDQVKRNLSKQPFCDSVSK